MWLRPRSYSEAIAAERRQCLLHSDHGRGSETGSDPHGSPKQGEPYTKSTSDASEIFQKAKVTPEKKGFLQVTGSHLPPTISSVSRKIMMLRLLAEKDCQHLCQASAGVKGKARRTSQVDQGKDFGRSDARPEGSGVCHSGDLFATLDQLLSFFLELPAKPLS